MDKIPAAYAMDWSIRLEKSLRSGKTGQRIEAIRELGSRLEWWHGDSELSIAACRIFNLIPCEDKFFLNAIFLRLVEAFRLGNKQIKNSIVALFLRIRKKRGVKAGILNKAKLENYIHLLRKVQQAYDEGGVEERTLALVLFGCWADLVKDSAGVRYIVLSSLVSSHALEMKAGLFAAGCLCELSDHFAFVFLEVFSAAFLSDCISMEMKLYGAKVFSKLRRSSSLAEKAYKVGFKLLTDSAEDDFSAVMLISLTKIASKWILILPAQIELLLMFLSEERSSRLQLASLKCLRLVLAEGSCCLLLLSNPEMHAKLLGVLNRLKTHELQLQALRILQKILPFTLVTSSFEEITETICNQLVVVKDMLRSSKMSFRVLPIDILADLCGKLLREAKATTPVEAADSLASVLISFILDRLFQLVTAHVDIRASAELFEVKRLLYSLFSLVGKHPHIPHVLLQSISLFISDFIKKMDMMRSMESDVLVYVSKIAASCLEAFEAPDAETLQVLDVLKLQAENVCRCGHFGSFTCFLYALLLHQHSSVCSFSGSRNSSVLLLEDRYASDFADKMLARNSCWISYKAGKIAACQGAWFTAASIFSQLTPRVRSPSCSSWMEFLSLFSTSERQLQLFLLKGVSLETRHHEHVENLLMASETLATAKRVLLAASDMRDVFRFQIWFSELRAKFLKAVIDAIKLLDDKNPVSCSSSIHSSIEVSLRWHALAKEFDLLSMVFTGMDLRSRMITSARSLSCSLMAFAVSFTFLVPGMNSNPEKFKLCVPENQRRPVLTLFLEDFIMRIRSSESRKKLLTLLKCIKEDRNCFPPPSKIPCFCYDAAAVSKLCEYSIGEIVGSSSKRAKNSSYLLWTVISEMVLIPFQTPKHFFSIRSAVSSELFVMNDGKALHRTSITPVAQLPLNLCLQLKNFTSIVPAKIIVHLILACQEMVESRNIGSEAKMSCRDQQQIDDMIELNEKLWNYVIHGGTRTSAFDSSSTGSHRYARFELSERGQGFSTCILDVSDLHPGCCYRIKWQCGYINTEGFFCSLLPENSGQPLFTILEPKIPVSKG